jgi:hypothetical protein
MRKLLVLPLLILSTLAFGQVPKLRLSTDSTKLNVNGTVINKGDDFLVNVQLDGNSNTTSRSLYFDFEFQNTAFDLVSIVNTGTGGNGGVLPYGSTINMGVYTYPGYSWNATQQNTTNNGNTNYQYSSYNYTQGGPKTIIRVYLNWASPNGLPYTGYSDLLRLRFKLKTTAQGNVWNPIKMNFAASYNQDGSTGSTLMEIPLTTVIGLNPDASKYVKANIDINGLDYTKMKVAFLNATTMQGPLFNVTSTGAVSVNDSLLTANTQYKILAMYNMDDMLNLTNAAVTVSDYTVAFSEFLQQNLDGTYKNAVFNTGIGYKAADVNRSGTLDGGDVAKLFTHVSGVANLVTLPAQYVAGSGGYMSLMTFKASEFDASTPSDWASSFPANQQQAYIYTTPATPGAPETINIKYLVLGDVNKSHSSQVVRGGNVAVNSFVNSPNININNINVGLSNVTVTSNVIEIPVKVNTNGEKLSALQFEFRFDPNKIKFEELVNEMPNTWYAFANKEEGVVKFGALDKELKTPVTGEVIPFKLKFSTLQSGLDINSYIKVTPNMDAANSAGYQLGINLNTTTIKLTGYNNF